MTDLTTLDLLSRDYEIPDRYPNNPRPAKAIVREVDLIADSNGIVISFSRANAKEDVSTLAKLKALFLNIGSGNYDFPVPIPKDPVPPFKTPLSLHNDELCYVIYILTKKNWKFAHDFSPITVSKTSRPDTYYESSHINASGNATEIDSNWNPLITPQPDCIAAYFIGSGKSSAYEDRLNLHVDLEFKDDNNTRSYMPIIIDPDIRWPGGSGG